MPQSFSGDVGSTEDSIAALPSTVMMGRQAAAPRSSSGDQRSPSADPAATSSFSTVGTVRYLECQRNHAAAIGGYAVDGCREFMASGEGGENALACAACGCHRSFHRRELVAP